MNTINDVFEDVRLGLGKYCTVVSVSAVEPTETAPLTGENGAACVMWRAECRDDESFIDYHAGGHDFVVEGVTFVLSDERGETAYQRVIDWNAATGAMGEARNRRTASTEMVEAFQRSHGLRPL